MFDPIPIYCYGCGKMIQSEGGEKYLNIEFWHPECAGINLKNKEIKKMTKPGVYKHYKGGLYRVLFTAIDASNATSGRTMVIYVSITQRDGLYVRCEAEFNQEVHDANGGIVKRFEYVGETE
jgi:hypothetical protein